MAVTARFLTGQYFNLLEPRIDPTGLLSSLILPTSEDSKFARSSLYDQNVSSPFRFNAQAGTVEVIVDLSRQGIPNGDFEAAFVSSLPYGSQWASTNATITRDTTTKRSGAASMKLVPTVIGQGLASCDLYARAGEKWHFEGSAYSEGTPATGILVQNIATGKFLKLDGTWTAGDYLVQTTTAAWSTPFSVDTVVEPYLTGTQDIVTLRVFFEVQRTGGGQAGYFDDCSAWPGFDFMSVHGHSIVPGTTVTFQSGGSSAVSTLRATMTPRHPSFYSVLGSVVMDRFAGLRIVTPNSLSSSAYPLQSGAVWLGEVVLGQQTTLLRVMDDGFGEWWDDPQIRQSTPAGHQRVVSRTGGQRVGADLGFRYTSTAEYRQARDEIIRRSRGGKYPIVLIPDDSNSEVCIYGRLAEGPFRLRRQLPTYYMLDSQLAVIPDPMPIFLD